MLILVRNKKASSTSITRVMSRRPTCDVYALCGYTTLNAERLNGNAKLQAQCMSISSPPLLFSPLRFQNCCTSDSLFSCPSPCSPDYLLRRESSGSRPSRCSRSCYPTSAHVLAMLPVLVPAQNVLKEPAVPIIVPPQHRSDIVSAHKQALHPSIDPVSTLASHAHPSTLQPAYKLLSRLKHWS
jgi:hypothetical protein